MAGVGVRAVLAVCIAAASATSVWAQDPRQNEPGKFDFYILSLSWSPSFCAADAERNGGRVPHCTERGLIRSSCTGSGRNMRRGIRNIARYRHHASIAASSLQCSI